MASSSTLGCS
ncbi:hypothetical protein D043_0519A, partial [Vibrio parahaemolyticus EKP-021]